MTTIKTSQRIAELNEIWGIVLPNVVAPSKAQWALWLLQFDLSTIKRTIAQAALKNQKTPMSQDHLLRYMHIVMDRVDGLKQHQHQNTVVIGEQNAR